MKPRATGAAARASSAASPKRSSSGTSASRASGATSAPRASGATSAPRASGATPKRAAGEAKPDAAAKPRPIAPRRKAGKRVPMDRDRLAALVAVAVKSLEDDKAEDVVVLDVTGRASFTDRMVIATGLVERQIEAMAAHLVENLGKEGLRLKRDAIQGSEDWVLIDAGDLVIHLFKPEARQAYDLEKMWGPDSPLGEAAPGEQSPI
nr:ribosome silencing factor [Roseococcus microcysteis]